MKLRVLGCHGGESPAHRCTCFLIDDVLAVDAGALTLGLSLAQQRRVRHVLVSHTHLDHVKDLAMLADNIVGDFPRTIEVVGASETLRMLKRHFFNDVIWPDFTRIPTPRRPVYRLVPLASGRERRLGDYRVRGVRVKHPVESTAFVVRGPSGSAVAISSDTGPTRNLWRELNRTPKLRAVLLELSFPNRLQALGDQVGHLTPHTLESELRKLEKDVPIFLYHLKPPYEADIRRELRGLNHSRVQVLRIDQTLRL